MAVESTLVAPEGRAVELTVAMVERDGQWPSWRGPLVQKPSEVETSHKVWADFLTILE